MTEMKYCPLCGNELAVGSVECDYCHAQRYSLLGIPLGYLYPEEHKMFNKLLQWSTVPLVLLPTLAFLFYWFVVYPILPK